METIGSRLKSLMRDIGISESDLARLSGVPQPSVNRIVNDRVKSPKYENVEKIAIALGVSSSYIMYGAEGGRGISLECGLEARGDESPRHEENTSENRGVALAAVDSLRIASVIKGGFLGSLSPVVPAIIKILGGNKYDRPGDKEPVYFYPELYWSEVEGFKIIDKNGVPKRLCSGYKVSGEGFWMSMKGDSMASPYSHPPTIPEGSKVLFDSDKSKVKPGVVVAVLFKKTNSISFRVLIEEGGEFLLKPLNPSYQVTSLTDEISVIACALEVRLAFLN
jgi:SOS-response transcriptional repressor LexA